MESEEAQRQVKTALWKKETGIDKVFSNSPEVGQALEALGIAAAQEGGAVIVEGYDELVKLREAGADFANKDHYMSSPRGRG